MHLYRSYDNFRAFLINTADLMMALPTQDQTLTPPQPTDSGAKPLGLMTMTFTCTIQVFPSAGCKDLPKGLRCPSPLQNMHPHIIHLPPKDSRLHPR